jgi:hypothetical protein
MNFVFDANSKLDVRRRAMWGTYIPTYTAVAYLNVIISKVKRFMKKISNAKCNIKMILFCNITDNCYTTKYFVMHFVQWQQRSRLHKKSSFGLEAFLHILSAAYFRCNLSLPILLLSITAIYLLLKLTFVTSMAAQKARHQKHFSVFIWNFPAPVNFAVPLTVTATPNCHHSASPINSITSTTAKVWL